MLLLLEKRNLLVLCIRTYILIVGLNDVHRLALALMLSSDFALNFAFLILQFLHDAEWVITHSTQDRATAPAVAPMTINATIAAGAECAFDIGRSAQQRPDAFQALHQVRWDGLQTAQEHPGTLGA